MEWNETFDTIIQILMPLLITAIGAALAYAAAYLKARTASIKNEDARKVVDNIIDRAHMYTFEAVRGTAQVYTDEIRKARADGKLTAEEAAEARRIAFEFFKTLMGQQGLKLLEETVGDVQAWFEKALEPAVGRLKDMSSAA